MSAPGAASSFSSTMSPTGVKLLGAMRRNIELLTELDKTDPAAVGVILAALLAHVRSWKPMATHGLPPMPEATRDVYRPLHDGNLYAILIHQEGTDAPVALVRVRDDKDSAVIALDREGLALLHEDVARVLAAFPEVP